MNWTKRIILAAFVLLLSAGSATAQQATQDLAPRPGVSQFAEQDVKSIRLLLSGYHEIADLEAFATVPDAPQIVDALARGPHGLIKDRALAALGRYWPSADVYLLYADVLTAEDTPEGTQHRVMLLFAKTFGDRAMPIVESYLAHEDARLRLTAVQALAQIGTNEAFARIDSHAETVRDPVMLKQIDRYARTIR